MNLAVIGSGGREHAICYKLKRSPRIKKLICIPGNAGTQKIAENIKEDILNFSAVYQIIKSLTLRNRFLLSFGTGSREPPVVRILPGPREAPAVFVFPIHQPRKIALPFRLDGLLERIQVQRQSVSLDHVHAGLALLHAVPVVQLDGADIPDERRGGGHVPHLKTVRL